MNDDLRLVFQPPPLKNMVFPRKITVLCTVTKECVFRGVFG